MADKTQLDLLKNGAAGWNKWRKERPDVTPDLIEADLLGADLIAANLIKADLSLADLRLAHLVETDLRFADLRIADLTGATLNGADLTGCIMGYTMLGDVDLSEVKGLETVEHGGPSSIGIDTIYRSKAEIPEVFLRGAGVPDNFIAEMNFLVGPAVAIEFYSCFISHSTKDKDFAERLYADLQREHVRCWFAPHDTHGGQKLHEQIDRAIGLHERLLLILSSDSMKSEWVKTEIAKARKREIREGKKVLFPVRIVSFEAIRDWECFDADTGKDSAREIREYFIPDFSDWNDPAKYKMAFDRLLSDLKAGDKLKAASEKAS